MQGNLLSWQALGHKIMAYISVTDLQEYLLAKGFVSEEVSTADATRLLAVAIGDWESLVGVRPFLAVSSVKVFDPRDIQADRRGWILDLSTPVSAVPTLVKSGVNGANVGTTLVQYDDWQLPDSSGPWTQIIFNTFPVNRLQITAPWGYTDSNGITAYVNDAIYALASARCVEENAGAQGNQTKIKTGLVEVTLDDPVPVLRQRALAIATTFRLS